MEEGGFFLLLPNNYAFSGLVYYCLRELEKARSQLEKAVEKGNPFVLALFYSLLRMVLLDSGEFESAQRGAENALKLAQENGIRGIEGISWIMLGRAIGKRELGHLSKAEERILKGIVIPDNLKWKPWVSIGHFYLGELYAERGEGWKAEESFNRAEALFQEMGMDYWLDRTRRLLERI